MTRVLRVCTAIRDAELEQSIRQILVENGHQVGPVERDDISNGIRNEDLLFIVENSYQEILDLIEHQNYKEMNFLPVIIVDTGNAKYQQFYKTVTLPHKYLNIPSHILEKLLPQLVLHMDQLRSVAISKKQLDYFFLFSDLFYCKKDSFQTALQKSLKEMLSFLYADKGSIMLLNSENNLVIEAATKKELIGIEVPSTQESVAWTVMKSQKSVFVDDIKKDDRFSQKVGEYTKDYFLSIPIIVKGEVKGVFNMSDKLLSLLFDKIDEDSARRFIRMLEPFFADYLR